MTKHRYRLPDLAKWERAKKGKEYPAGCTLLQVSASRGQLVYMDQPGQVDSKYCVIQPDPAKVDPYFLHLAIDWEMPEFLAKEQTGINIQPECLMRFMVTIPDDRSEQERFAKAMKLTDAEIQEYEKQLAGIKGMKNFLINNLFPHEGENVPRLRFKEFC